MTPEEQRLYEELSEMTGATPSAQRMLDEDAGLGRCLAALTGQKPATLTDIEECYHDVEPPDNVEEREFSSDEQGMYAALSAMMDIAPRAPGRSYAETEDVERSVRHSTSRSRSGSRFTTPRRVPTSCREPLSRL